MQGSIASWLSKAVSIGGVMVLGRPAPLIRLWLRGVDAAHYAVSAFGGFGYINIFKRFVIL
jgi:hypothetical protein